MEYRQVFAVVLLVTGFGVFVETGEPLYALPLVSAGILLILWELLKIGVMIVILLCIMYLVDYYELISWLEEFLRAVGV